MNFESNRVEILKKTVPETVPETVPLTEDLTALSKRN